MEQCEEDWFKKKNISIGDVTCIESLLNQLNSAESISQDDIDDVVTSITKMQMNVV